MGLPLEGARTAFLYFKAGMQQRQGAILYSDISYQPSWQLLSRGQIIDRAGSEQVGNCSSGRSGVL